jgi:hypothetical protein
LDAETSRLPFEPAFPIRSAPQASKGKAQRQLGGAFGLEKPLVQKELGFDCSDSHFLKTAPPTT